jgi:hypothetical protein
MALSKQFLSGSTNGRGVKVTATATAGTLIHTAHATAKDEVSLFAVNRDSSSRTLTIEFGGTTSPDDLIEVTLPPDSGMIPVVPGIPLSNSLAVRAFASAANVVSIFGFVNRISA